MGELDNMLETQQKNVQEEHPIEGNSYLPKISSGSTLLQKVSAIYIIVGYITIALGIIFIIAYLATDKTSKEITFSIAGITNLGTGLFCLFAGCVGQAIDDIRNNTKK